MKAPVEYVQGGTGVQQVEIMRKHNFFKFCSKDTKKNVARAGGCEPKQCVFYENMGDLKACLCLYGDGFDPTDERLMVREGEDNCRSKVLCQVRRFFKNKQKVKTFSLSGLTTHLSIQELPSLELMSCSVLQYKLSLYY